MAAKDKLERAIAKEVSKDIASLIDREFAAKKSPNNKPWAPRKKDGQPFDNRDTVRSSIRVEAKGSEILITSTKPYTGYLDQGTKYIEARQMYDQDRLPSKWANQIDSTIEKVLEKNIDSVFELLKNER